MFRDTKSFAEGVGLQEAITPRESVIEQRRQLEMKLYKLQGSIMSAIARLQQGEIN